MYHTCNSSRAIGASSPWDAIQDEQAGISTIPEEAVSSLTDCAPTDQSLQQFVQERHWSELLRCS